MMVTGGFRSISNQLRYILGIEIGHRDVRLKAVEHLANTFDDMVSSGSCTANELFNKIVANREAAKQSTTRVWADDYSLSAFSSSHRVAIHVLYSRSLNWNVIMPPPEIDTIADCYMLHWEDIHFDTILYNSSVKNEDLFQRLAKRRRGRANTGNSSI